MSFCVAGVAGRDILTCLQMVSKVVLCDRRNPAARFSEYGFPFSWHVQHFGRVHVHFAWQAQQFRRVVLRVFLLIALSGLRQVVTTCKSRGKRGASRECHFAWQVQYFVQIHCVWM